MGSGAGRAADLGPHWGCGWSPLLAGSLRWADRRLWMEVAGVDERQGSPRRFGRRRRANVEGGRKHQHAVKVTPEEEALLLQRALALGVTVPRLLVESALADERGETVTERRNAAAELFGVYRLLGTIANNVNQMAKATNATGEVQRELSSTMAAVRRVADRIDAVLDELVR